jgi:hypothetical protein
MGGFIVPGFSIIAAILAGTIVAVIGFSRLAESRTGFIMERKRSFSLFLLCLFGIFQIRASTRNHVLGQGSQAGNNLIIDYYLEAIFIPSRLHSIIATIFIIVILSFALLSGILAFQPVYAQEEQIWLGAVTDKGTFKVEITWTSNDIGSANMFEIHFFDPDTGSEIEYIKYDISIYTDDRPEIQRLDQTSIFQEFFFEEVGSYEIRIDDIEDLGERAIIPIQVTPEFQLKVFILAASAVGMAMLAARASNGNNLFRHPIN